MMSIAREGLSLLYSDACALATSLVAVAEVVSACVGFAADKSEVAC
jgi:hypothetical protein